MVPPWPEDLDLPLTLHLAVDEDDGAVRPWPGEECFEQLRLGVVESERVGVRCWNLPARGRSSGGRAGRRTPRLRAVPGRCGRSMWTVCVTGGFLGDVVRGVPRRLRCAAGRARPGRR